MIRKSNYTEYIDKYLSGELTGDDLREFNVEMAINADLEEEITLHQEIEEAIQEQDITALRDNLQEVMQQDQELVENQEFEYVEDQYFNFDLSEELSSFKEFTSPVNLNDLINISESLPKIHLAQHNIADKENIHHFYKEQNAENQAPEEEFELTPQDEALFNDVQNALEEKDILELRANLQQVAANIPAHERSTEEIDQYINDELEGMELVSFEDELEMNAGLARDIELYSDIDQASAENDIMDLRANLLDISKTESSTTRKAEEIDQYLNEELSEAEVASFETELTNNLDLAAELELHKEIDKAVQEDDIMGLRARLEGISKDVVKQKRKERSFAAIPSSRVAIATIAASLMLILSIAGVISRSNKAADEGELYSQYYETYQATGVFRSNDADTDAKLSKAMHLFNSKEYTEALGMFNQVLEQNKGNAACNFYSGVAYQETGQFDKAVSSYQAVVKDKNNLFTEQAEWYIGLCYLQTENRKKAYKQFKRIASSDSYYQEKANAVIRKIKYIE